VTCSATTGSLTVSASTTGSSLDADGYTVTVDGGSPQAIGINGSVTFNGLAAGGHSIALSGVAANCTVSGGKHADGGRAFGWTRARLHRELFSDHR